MKYWKKTVEVTKENFMGTTPPSIFVGRNFYPKVFVGVLTPPEREEDAWLFDYPEKWYEINASIDDIMRFRGRLIYTRWRENVFNPKQNFTEVMQESVMSKKPIDLEVWLKRKPIFRVNFDVWATPIGNPAKIKDIKLVDNPKVERKVEYLVSDTDVKAVEAVNELYFHRIEISRIQKMFSAGILGMKTERKLVPLRWAITAVHDTIGKSLLETVKTFPEINNFMVFENTYIGNHYLILLIPNTYQYELIEIKYPKSVWNVYGKEPSVFSDYEPYCGRKRYADNTGGAFYAGRLGVLEFLKKVKRQASVLIIREVTEKYTIPVGIWQMQETIRHAFDKKPRVFETFEDSLNFVSSKLSIPFGRIERKSKLLRVIKQQRKITKFISSPTK